MPKPTPMSEKQKWLSEYQKGMSEFALSKKYHRDVRTIKKGIEDAIREQELRQARVNFLTERLNRHQDTLLNELTSIKESTGAPETSYAPLSWHEGENSVFSYKLPEKPDSGAVVKEKKRERKVEQPVSARRLLEQHLGNDVLIKSLRSYEEAYTENVIERKVFQKTIVNTLVEITKLKVLDKRIKASYVCSYTTGDFLYKKLLNDMKDREFDEFCQEIETDAINGNVTYSHNVLIEAPGKEKLYRKRLCRAFSELHDSRELVNVLHSQRMLEEAATRLHQAIDEILLLGMVTGRCRVCRRLGL